MDRKSAPLLPAIVINYLVAFIAGLLLFEGELSIDYVVNSSWFTLSSFTGVLFIIGFFLIGYTTQQAGIAVTTIANKMSVIIPISFSILYFNESMSYLKSGGIVLALLAVLMAAYRKRNGGEHSKITYLPLIMFLVVGGIDAIVKLAQESYVPESDVSIFSSFTFGVAGVIGIILLVFNRSVWKSFGNYWVWLLGLALGLGNFGSMYFLIYALNRSGLDSSIVYGVNHLGVILLSIILALSFFREKLSRLNIAGIILAVLAISILTMLV